MRIYKRHYTYALLVGLFLFLSVGHLAYAATNLPNNDPKDGEVQSEDVSTEKKEDVSTKKKENKIFGVISCGFEEGVDRCTFCHLLALFNKFISLLIFFAGIVFVIKILWVGFNLLNPFSESVTKQTELRGTLANSIIGFVLLICSWVIVNLIFNILTPITQDSDQKWYQPLTQRQCDDIIRDNKRIYTKSSINIDKWCKDNEMRGNISSGNCEELEDSRKSLNECVEEWADKCKVGEAETPNDSCSDKKEEFKKELTEAVTSCFMIQKKYFVTVNKLDETTKEKLFDICYDFAVKYIPVTSYLSGIEVLDITYGSCQDHLDGDYCDFYNPMEKQCEEAYLCPRNGSYKEVYILNKNLENSGCTNVKNIKPTSVHNLTNIIFDEYLKAIEHREATCKRAATELEAYYGKNPPNSTPQYEGVKATMSAIMSMMDSNCLTK